MQKLTKVWLVALIFIPVVYSTSSASCVKTFVPSKPWQVTIDINEFDPCDLFGHKTILAGSAKGAMHITVIVEKTKTGTKPVEIRELYGQRSLTASGQAETARRIEVNDIAVLLFRWAKPKIPELSEEKIKWAERVIQNTWSYHGYAVKDDVAFDIHLSADMTKCSEKQLLNTIKSFRIEPSTEIEELSKLYKDLDGNTGISEKEKLILSFIRKYPTNAEAQFLLGECYLQTKELQKAKDAYIRALQNHRIQPFANPISLFGCYDGAGMSCGMLHQYELSRKYLESGYKLAKKIKDPQVVALSAYNLACLYAETNEPDNSIKYLAESIKLNPDAKESAKKDTSFTNIKEDKRFKELIYE